MTLEHTDRNKDSCTRVKVTSVLIISALSLVYLVIHIAMKI